jgi:superfamily II DNA or RNA helicase
LTGAEPPDPEQYFRTHSPAVQLDWQLVETGRLRKAQLGAAWGLGAHFASAEDPAQVILPTGVGKTLILTLAPFLVPCRKVLVLAPSRLVRRQLVTAFSTLADLRQAGVIADEMPSPKVRTVSRRPGSEEDWRLLGRGDVVIGTVAAVSHLYDGVHPVPEDLFDLLLVDEAHHVAAKTWAAMLDRVGGPKVLVTATPFRRDRRHLPGRIAFRYPLRKAIEDGVYAPVTFAPVAAADGEPVDAAIARHVAAAMATDEHRIAGSRVLVRTGRVADAHALVATYRAAGLSLEVIEAKTSAKRLGEILGALAGPDLHGIATVGVATEGFDFPRLKIAAYHTPHRSLAPTIQFLGRLARIGPDAEPVLFASLDAAGDEVRELYGEERAWAELVPALVDQTVGRVVETRDFIADGRSEGFLPLRSLTFEPARSTRVLRVDPAAVDLDIAPLRLGGQDVVFKFYEPSRTTLALVTRQPVRPPWLRSDELDTWGYHLHLACLTENPGLLFVSSEHGTVRRDLLDAVGVGLQRQLSSADLRKLLWHQDTSRYFSVGVRSAVARLARHATYVMRAGSSVEKSVHPSEARLFDLGHVMGRGTGAGTFGMSVKKSKVWEPEGAQSLLGFREWCEELASVLVPGPVQEGVPGLPFGISDTFDRFDSSPLGALLDVASIVADLRLRVAAVEIDPLELDVTATVLSDDELELRLEHVGSTVWSATFATDGTVTAATGVLLAADRATGEMTDLADYLHDVPPTVFLADGGVIEGARRFIPPAELGDLPAGAVEPNDWSGCNIRKEVDSVPPDGTSIFEATVAKAASATWIVRDHGGGEIADFIAIWQNPGERLDVRLCHCKASSKPAPGARLADLYDALVQVMRSIRWADAGPRFWQEIHDRLANRSYTSVVHGDVAALASLLAGIVASGEAPETTYIACAIQPGVDGGQVAGWTEGETALLAVHDWCAGQGAEFRLLCSNPSA